MKIEFLSVNSVIFYKILKNVQSSSLKLYGIYCTWAFSIRLGAVTFEVANRKPQHLALLLIL